MTFSKWLRGQIYESTPIGDLARDSHDDPHFPTCDDQKRYIDYLESCNACSGALDALDEAFQKYVEGVKRFGHFD